MRWSGWGSRCRAGRLVAGLSVLAFFSSIDPGDLLAQYPPKTPPRIRFIDSSPQPLARGEPGATLFGTVTDRDGRPLAGIQVVALGAGRATLTDADGRYRLQGLPAGGVEVHLGDDWFTKERRIMRFTAGEEQQYDVELFAQAPIWCHEGSARQWAIACRERGRNVDDDRDDDEDDR